MCASEFSIQKLNMLYIKKQSTLQGLAKQRQTLEFQKVKFNMDKLLHFLYHSKLFEQTNKIEMHLNTRRLSIIEYIHGVLSQKKQPPAWPTYTCSRLISRCMCMNSPLYNVDKLMYFVDILWAFYEQENFNVANTQQTVPEGHIGWCVVLNSWLLALLASAVSWQYFQGLYLTLALLSLSFYIMAKG